MHILRLCNQLQEAADGHARLLGVGTPRLFEQGQAWMLTRMRLVLTALPQHGQVLRIKTWPEGGNRLYAWRQYVLLHEDRVLVRGASAWVVVNIAERSLARMPSAVQEIVPPGECPPPLPLGDDPAKEELMDEHTLTCTLQARHSDLDRNGHVNNGVLCQWLMEPALPLALEKGLQLAELSVRFKSEMTAKGTALSHMQTFESKDQAAVGPSADMAPSQQLLCRHVLSKEDDTPLVVGRSLWRSDS